MTETRTLILAAVAALLAFAVLIAAVVITALVVLRQAKVLADINHRFACIDAETTRGMGAFSTLEDRVTVLERPARIREVTAALPKDGQA
jgi:hypothetical protein